MRAVIILLLLVYYCELYYGMLYFTHMCNDLVVYTPLPWVSTSGIATPGHTCMGLCPGKISECLGKFMLKAKVKE